MAEDPRLRLPEELVRRVQSGAALPLIGSGVSRPSGVAGWDQLADRLRQGLEQWLGRSIEQQELDLLAVPRMYARIQESRLPLYRVIDEAVGAGFKPNELHRKLAQMPLPSLLTTNWDTLVEQELAEDGPVNVIRRDPDVSTWLESSARQVIKMHGCVSVRETIVIGEEDYHRFYSSPSLLRTLVEALIATRTIFALGFGMRDAFVKMLFSYVSRLTGESGNPHYVVVPDKDANKLHASYLEASGFIVIPVPVSAQDPYGTRSFLDALHAATYAWTNDRLERTQMLLRETVKMRHYLGPDRTIRVRATMGPLATPAYELESERAQTAFAGGAAQYAAEFELRELCVELAQQHQVRVRMIGNPVDRDFVLAKGYLPEVYADRLRALIELAEVLGDRFEFAAAPRQSHTNSWQVADVALIDSTKVAPDESRLFDRSELTTDRGAVTRAGRWFDEEFAQLVERDGGLNAARMRLLDRAHELVGS